MMFLRPAFVLSLCTLFGVAMAVPLAAQERSTFGVTTQSEAALIGVLYDLKQTEDRQRSPIHTESYSRVIEEFLLKNWDERVLNRYYRVTRPLYTTQIFVPMIEAVAAPRAFGVERLVQPSMWVIHYKAQVSAPSGGMWRFVGSSDDLLAVAVNRRTVLVAARSSVQMPRLNWRAKEPDGAMAANNQLRYGDWISLKEGEIIDLDVITGERPGGGFNAFLVVQKQGGTYAQGSGGHPILPIFQVAPFNTPASDISKAPLFAKGHPPWKSYQ
jgi:hypothetical protein